MNPAPSEAESLPVHVGKCEERYRSLEMRIARLERAIYWSTGILITGMGGIIAKLALAL